MLKPAPTSGAERWIAPLRWAALAVFIAVPVVAPLARSLAGRLVWTVFVAALPLFIVLIGYHRWRRICPLYFFANLPVLMRIQHARRVSRRFESHYYYLPFAIFIASLWLRLIATNGDGYAIAGFFVLISVAAFFCGLAFTGRTWCNYICPVSFVEKIYTEPTSLKPAGNSQCGKCTACKSSCPDISEENGYWKEIKRYDKQAVYFAFPGLVFGFYLYYYLQSGTWDSYFSGRWTNQPNLLRNAFLPGHDSNTAGFFFLHAAPRALTVLMVLALCALLSFLLFALVERIVGGWLRRREASADAERVRHVTFTIASFTAFLTFYTFAGAPTLRKLPWAPQLFAIVVVLTATLVLVRRLGRSQQAFAEEAVARNIVKRWQWIDIQPPSDLHDAFLIHTVRMREAARGYTQVLTAYKEAIRETVADGFATPKQVDLLDALRNELQIKRADHEKILAELEEEDRLLITDPARQTLAEKRLQLNTYSRALERYLSHSQEVKGVADQDYLAKLRAEYRITPEEHGMVLAGLLGNPQEIARRFAEEFAVIAQDARTIAALEAEPSPLHAFLADLLRARKSRAAGRIVQGLLPSPGDDAGPAISADLCADDPTVREAAVRRLCARTTPAIAGDVLPAYQRIAMAEDRQPSLHDQLRALTGSPDPYIRSVAFSALSRPREQAAAAGVSAELTTIEQMIALHAVPIFSSLMAEDLAELAESSTEISYAPNDTLCVEGERGDEIFILLSGEVDVWQGVGNAAELLGTEKAGEIVGELAVLKTAPRSATVRARAGGARALRLDGSVFRDTLHANPGIALGVIDVLVERVRGVGDS
jgi:Cyclic nucleotide-binding domain